MRVLRATLAALLTVLSLAPATLAQSLVLSTPFPAVVADAGATAQFDVTVTTETPERVDLSVVAQPDGWTTTLRGGGSTISAVTTGPTAEAPTQTSAVFTAEVAIPEDAAAGSSQVIIEARSAAGLTTQLSLDLTIEEHVPGTVVLESDFPTQSGSADETFSFDLELRNRSNQEVTFNFEGEGPPGWRVQARPSGDTAATTAVVEAGGLTTVTVSATPPADAPAATYPIVVRALGGPQPAEAELAIEITGSYGMELTTSDQRLSARLTVGSPTSVTLAMTNTGTAPLENVELSANPPGQWDVTFETETVPLIQPGATQNVDATIQAAGNSVAGDYVVTFTARNDEVNDRIEVRTTVETSPVGGLIGLGVLAIVVIGLFFVFQRYGRR